MPSTKARSAAVILAAALVISFAFAAPAAVFAKDAPDYQDDRSTPEAVLQSLYNAINLRQYSRAWGYWESAPPNQSFDDFQQGYADTASVELTTGDTQGSGAAGSEYFDTPVTLVATMNDGSVQTFVGCYVVRLVNPSIQAVPPYQPMSIYRADLQQVDNDADTATLMSRACENLS